MPTDPLFDLLETSLAPGLLPLRVLGSGAMGTVYAAREPAVQRIVAIKVMTPKRVTSASTRLRFEREIETIGRINHPNVVPVYRVGVLPGDIPYFVMQFVDGGTLKDRLEGEGPLPPAEVRRIIAQVASGLAAAHRLGVVHRDIKPGNLLYDSTSGRVLIADFGITRHVISNEAEPADLTVSGVAVGTPGYMSPEQRFGATVTDRSDIYSLGVVGWELLTGQQTFRPPSPKAGQDGTGRSRTTESEAVPTDIDPDTEALLIQCLAEFPEDRPAAEEIANRLGETVKDPFEWPPPGMEPVHGRAPRVAGMLMAAELGLLIPPLALLEMGTETLGDVGITAALVAGFVVAVLATIVAHVVLFRAVSTVSRGVAAGLQPALALEVFGDDRKDGGLLLAGYREYALVTAGQRLMLRRFRRTATVLAIAGAALPAPLFLMLALGKRLRVAGFPPSTLVLVPSLVLGLVAAALWVAVPQAVRRARARLRRPDAPAWGLSDLMRAWQRSVSARLTTGPPTAVNWRIAVVALGALLSILGAATAALIVGVGMIGPTNWRELWLGGSAFPERGQAYWRQLAPARLPADSSVSRLEAGRALLEVAPPVTISETADPPPAGKPAQVDPVLDSLVGFFAGSPEAWERPELPDLVARHLAGERGRRLTAAIRRLARTRPDYLTAAGPLWADHSGKSLLLLTPDPELVTSALRLHALNGVADARAGRFDSAEAKLREALSAALNIHDDAYNPFGAAAAARFVPEVVQALDRSYGLSGRVRPLWLIVARDGIERESEAFNREYQLRIAQASRHDLESTRNFLLTSITNEAVPRYKRWIALDGASYLVCTNLREILFGPDRDILEALRHASASLAETPADSALFVEVSRGDSPTRFEPPPGAPFRYRLALAFSRTATALTGNHRLSYCTDAWAGPAIYRAVE